VIASTQGKRATARCLPDGLRFGKYQIVRLIAVGGMSEVYEALHSGLDKRVALKVLRPDLAENLEARERFLSEGVNAARIRHINVVDVTDVGVVDDLPYLVMSLLDGEDLGAVYGRHGRLAVADLVDLLLPVTAAIAVGHAHGVVHRDLKPDNIFLHQEGCRLIPKVLDFGVSRAMNGRRITVNTSIFGTPQYMAPEQARGGHTDERTDQYALGVILYEGLTGHLPRDSANPLELLHSVAFDSFQRPSEHVELPHELEAVILRAMAQEPDERFASMRDLALALLPFASAPAQEYWGLELQSMPLPAAANAPQPALARHPTHPPHSPLLAATQTRSASVVELAIETPVARANGLRAPAPVGDSLQPQTSAVQPRPTRQRRVFWVGAIAGTLLGIGGAWFGGRAYFGATSTVTNATTAAAVTHEQPRDIEVEIQVEPPTATLLLDGKQVGVGSYRARLPRDGKLHELRASAAGFITRSVNFRDEAPPREMRLNPSAPVAVTPSATATHVSPVAATTAAVAVAPAELAPGRASRWTKKRTSETQVNRPVASIDESAIALDAQTPKVRIVDEYEPRVRVIE